MAQGGLLGNVLGLVGNIAGDIAGIVVGLTMAGGNLKADQVPLIVSQTAGWVVVILAVLGLVTALMVAVRNFTK